STPPFRRQIRLESRFLQGSTPTIPLAQKKGFFKEEGLDAEVIEMRSPAVAVVALANGEIDYFSVIGSSVTAALRGLPIKVVACFIPCSPLILIAKPEFKEVQQLKAKTVGFGEAGVAVTC